MFGVMAVKSFDENKIKNRVSRKEVHTLWIDIIFKEESLT